MLYRLLLCVDRFNRNVNLRKDTEMEYLTCDRCQDNSWSIEWCDEYPELLILRCKCGYVETIYTDGEKND